VRASESDYYELTELTKKSKAYWGYSLNQIKEWNEVLTITEKYISRNYVYKLVLKDQMVGYYSYFNVNDKKVKLDNLFVLPKFIGNKYGDYLMKNFMSRVSENGFKIVTLDSDPNAENFYKKFGFKVVGKLKSSIKNRFLPIMEKEI